jgi:hypothetical protein
MMDEYTTRELLQELMRRGEVTYPGDRPEDAEYLLFAASDLLDTLPQSMLDYTRG